MKEEHYVEKSLDQSPRPLPTKREISANNRQLTFGGVSIGDRFRKLTVLCRTDNKGRHACWMCRCDCGQQVVVRADRLRSGATGSCGCAKREYQEARQVAIEKGISFRNFGKVFVLGTVREFMGRKQVHAVCICRYCAGANVQRVSDVLRRDFRGCDCPYIGTIEERIRKHGFPPPWPRRKRESIEITMMRAEWRTMIARCHDPNNRDYPMWGGCGIVVCDRWRNSFNTFLADNGVKPLDKTLDRIDNNGPYSPANCRWATRQVQTENRRNTIFIQYHGRGVTLGELARQLGISYAQAYRRYRAGDFGDRIAAGAAARGQR